MEFESINQLRKYILSRCESSIIKAQNQVYQVIDRFVKEFYAEYTPKQYERLYQIYSSLVKSDIVKKGDGYEAYVFYDLSRLDHYTQTHEGTWTEEEILSVAAHGSHGGYKVGTAIWDEPLLILNREAYNILKRMLIESGIPIK